MAEVGLDLAAANRFISSLSKSLQALCHGCMEFDSGIEIGGYIYVSVDRGSKVDYVLNEMVQKNDNNSMKFISNSYLSKKDKQIQTRDGACSPVMELQSHSFPPQHQQRDSFQYSGSRQQRSNISSHSRISRAAQKRAWSGSDRLQRKYSRGGKSSSQPSHLSSNIASYTSKTTNNSQSFVLPDVPGDHDGLSEESKQISVKQEVFTDERGSDTGDALTNENCDTIKSDPDSVSNMHNYVPSYNKVENEGTDYSEKNNGATYSADNNDIVSAEIASSSTQSQLEYDPADLPVSFNYSHQPDISIQQADISNDDFQVIEIGDEDRDVEAMFADNHNPKVESSLNPEFLSSKNTNFFSEPSINSFNGEPSINLFNSEQSINSQTRGVTLSQCQFCGEKVLSLFLKQHLSQYHGTEMPYWCKICRKGFWSQSGYYNHKYKHEGRKFTCPVCDNKFNQKIHLKKHLGRIHNLEQCRICLATFSLGQEFESHVIMCASQFEMNK